VACFYKNTIIVNDTSIVVRMTIVNDDTTWSHLQSSIILIESSITHLENIYSTSVTHDNHHRKIKIFLYQKLQGR